MPADAPKEKEKEESGKSEVATMKSIEIRSKKGNKEERGKKRQEDGTLDP